MFVLLVAATEIELGLSVDYRIPNGECASLITGIGISNATHALTRAVLLRRPDLVINLGLCGSFRQDLTIGEVVHIHTDVFAEMGTTMANGEFLDLGGMGFPLFEHNGQAFYNVLRNPNHLDDYFSDNPITISGQSVTVSRVTGDRVSIDHMVRTWNPDFETMEGASIAHVCTVESIPYFQLRSISNYVEPRDTSRWKVPLACENLQTKVTDLLAGLRK